MTMPRGRVMALSRKEPTVKARFSISSWSLQMVQPFICRNSSSSFTWLSSTPPASHDRLWLELFPVDVGEEEGDRKWEGGLFSDPKYIFFFVFRK